MLTRSRLPRIALFVLVAGFLLLQLVRPARTNPPVDPALTLERALTVPPEVDALLMRSCADCHSHQTVWPWYTDVAPASWLVIRDTNQGRRHLNFSTFGKLDAHQRARKLQGMCNAVTEGEMPMWQYTLIHTGTKLTDSDRTLLCAWTSATAGQLGAKATGEPAETPHGLEAAVMPRAARDGGSGEPGSAH